MRSSDFDSLRQIGASLCVDVSREKTPSWALRGVPTEARAFCSPPGCPITLSEVPVVKVHFAAFAVRAI